MSNLTWVPQGVGTMTTNPTGDGVYYMARAVGYGVTGASRYRLTQWDGHTMLRTELTDQPYTLAEQWETER